MTIIFNETLLEHRAYLIVNGVDYVTAMSLDEVSVNKLSLAFAKVNAADVEIVDPVLPDDDFGWMANVAGIGGAE